MSRITPPVHKFSHAIRTMSSAATRSSTQHRPLQASVELEAECSRRRLHNSSRSELNDRVASQQDRGFHAQTKPHHRPTAARPVIPLMQGFRTSAPTAATHDHSTIDFMILPSTDADDAAASALSELRVPLLPDNYNPNRFIHAAETLDAPVAKQEIHIVAAHPEVVVPSALSEVVGNDALEMDLSFLTRDFTESPAVMAEKTSPEPSAVGELLRGMVDDIFGGASKKVAL